MAEPTLWKLDDHTRAKHQMLRAYVQAWLAVMGQQTAKAAVRTGRPARLLLVDGFAGPGRYQGGETGSPLIMLNALLEHRYVEKLAGAEFVYLFIEHHRLRVAHLERELEEVRLPKNVTVLVEHGEFETRFSEILGEVREKQGHSLIPTFAFIDPFGYAAASMSLTGQLLDFPRCEALIFLPLSYIARFVSRDGQEDAMNSLFGSERWREAIPMEGAQRREFLLGLFEGQLREQGGIEHVRSFELHTADGQDYRLVFATEHDKGLKLMKRAMWSVDPIRGTRYIAARRGDGQEVLVTSDKAAVDTQPLLEHLRRKFAHEWFSIEQAEQATLLETPFLHDGHLKDRTLAPAEKAELLAVDRSGGQRRFAAGVRMRFVQASTS